MKYKLFGSNTGLYASEVILGAANFGTRKGYGATPQESKKILSAYTDAGGNFIDISDLYQFGEAEEIVGNFLKNQRIILLSLQSIQKVVKLIPPKAIMEIIVNR